MAVKVKERDGSWWLFIDYKGRRKAKKLFPVGTNRTATREEAELVAAKVTVGMKESGKHALVDGPIGMKAVTLAEYGKAWLIDVAKNTLKDNTRRFYEVSFRLHIEPVIGARPVRELGRADCRAVAAACHEKGLRSRSVEGVCRTLSSLLTLAVEDGLLGANPAFRLGRHTRNRDEVKAEINPLTREEVEKLLAATMTHFPDAYPFILTAVRTGMRLGELAGLEWGDVQFDGRFIEVRRNKTGGKITTPKNGKVRRVDMSNGLTEELKKLLVKLKEQKLKKGAQLLPAHVFCDTDGGRLDPDNFRRRVFHPLLAKAGLRRIRIHDLRHTFASLMIQDNANLAYVSKAMGHSSIKTTVDIYGHLVPGANRLLVDRLDATATTESATPAQPDPAKAESAEPVSA